MRGLDGAEALGRRAEVHSRLLTAYRKLKADDERREFRKDLARKVGRTEESVCRWLGMRSGSFLSPPRKAVDAVEAWLEGRES